MFIPLTDVKEKVRLLRGWNVGDSEARLIPSMGAGKESSSNLINKAR